MYYRRVFILTSQPLFAQGVRSLLSGQAGIEIVGVAACGIDSLNQVGETNPDVIVIEAKLEEQGRLIAKVMEHAPGAKVIGLTLEDNRLYIYYQQTKKSRGVDDLVKAIQEPLQWCEHRPEALRLLILFQGDYGKRIVENIRRFAGIAWKVEAWRIPPELPPMIDDPSTFLPMHFPNTDVVLSLGESPNMAQLVPHVIERTDAQAFIAPIDNASWLPKGAVNSLRDRLSTMGVAAVFPKPFCSLTECSYNVQPYEVKYDDEWITEFAKHFGQPDFRIECDQGEVVKVRVKRDAACGCARFIAQELIGTDTQIAAQLASTLCHQYPCKAAKHIDQELEKSLLHITSNLIEQAIQIKIMRQFVQKAHPTTEKNSFLTQS